MMMPTTRSVSLRLDPGATAVVDMRHRVVEQLEAWGLPRDTVEAVALTAHELVANARLHGHPPVELRLVNSPSELLVEVRDTSTDRPRRLSVAPDEEHGRGLQVVEALASAWGATVGSGSKVVWARHRIAAAGSGPMGAA
jgi:anti-sigma regulatory factor (Ser/Thr protein kinase)